MMASQKIKEDISLQFVLNMTFHEKFALLAMVNTEKYLKKGKFIVTGDVYRIYHDMCKFAHEESLSLAAISQKITKFKMMGIINANVSSRGRGGLTSEFIHWRSGYISKCYISRWSICKIYDLYS